MTSIPECIVLISMGVLTWDTVFLHLHFKSCSHGANVTAVLLSQQMDCMGFNVRARLHQASASKLRQLCDDASDFVLTEISGVA